MSGGAHHHIAVEPSRGGATEEWSLRLAFLVSSMGDWIYRFALPLLVLQLTGSALSTALVYVLEFVPYIFIGLVAGNLADRANRRRLLIICDTASAAVVTVIAVLAWLSISSVPLIYVVALALAAIRPFSFPAFQGFVVERITAERRPAVNAWVQGTDSSA
jgi:MFS family permease